MKRLRISLLIVSLGLLGPTLGAANQVQVVDAAGGPGVHVTVQAAVDAAGDGDVVLVRPGAYGAFGIIGKGVAVVGDPGAAGVRPTIERAAVWSVGAGQRVTLRGLDIDQPPSFFGATEALSISACAGPVIVEDCLVRGGNDHGAYVSGSSRVGFVRCTLEPALGGSGIFSSLSTLHVVDSTVSGAKGQNALWTGSQTIPAGEGMPAIWLGSSFLALAGGTATGGAGGDGLLAPNGSCVAGGTGGPALFVFGIASPQAFHLDATLVGGAGGPAAAGCGNGGAPGAGVKLQNGTVTSLPETLRTLTVTSPVREGAVVRIDVTGQPGEPAFLLVGPAAAVDWLGAHTGTLLPSPFLVTPVGALSAAGALTVSVPVSATTLPAGVDVLEAFVQVIVPGGAGQGVLGSGSVVAVVDGAL